MIWIFILVVAHHCRVGEVMPIGQGNRRSCGVVHLLVCRVWLPEMVLVRVLKLMLMLVLDMALARGPLVGGGGARHRASDGNLELKEI